MNHWKNGRAHRAEYPEFKTADEYEQAALTLIESSCCGDIVGNTDKNGIIIRYNRKTNDFVKGHPDTGISTMFRPANGEDYYKQQKEEDVKNGGRV